MNKRRLVKTAVVFLSAMVAVSYDILRLTACYLGYVRDYYQLSFSLTGYVFANARAGGVSDGLISRSFAAGTNRCDSVYSRTRCHGDRCYRTADALLPTRRHRVRL